MINEALSGPYTLNDLLNGGEGDIGKLKNVKEFADGQKKTLSKVILNNSPLFNTIDKMVWNNNNSIFGPVVCFHIFL